MIRFARIALLSAQAFVAITAFAGGLALIFGSLNPDWGAVIVPPAEYLEGSPFSSYLVPGMSLIVLVAGVHAAAFVATIMRSRWSMPLAAAGGFACLIWIFIQMIYIPFSLLQALYFALGLVELGVTMLLLGVLTHLAHPHRSTYVAAHAPATPGGA
ncbi:hypothetical protein [Microbacterium sp. LWH3-1.2]|uniref:hypothetical protein n=1 Tax=Microbacterium sp. LWH3-1.2 TaxID=3135256 RepID=UPI00344AAC77